MNFFFEDYPETVKVCGIEVPVVTDFREYIKLFAMLKDESLKEYEKICYISQYFLKEVPDLESAIYALNDFVKMSDACQDREKTLVREFQNHFFHLNTISRSSSPHFCMITELIYEQ